MEEFIAQKLSYENLVALVRALAEGNITVDQLVQSVNGKTGKVELSADDVGARPDTWMPSYEDVGAEKSGTAASLVNAHNANNVSHNEIRVKLQSLANRINAVLDSDDTTLDALSEIVAYIKKNKSLIDGITASKVNVADIINNLFTNMADKPLAAAQGVVLKGLIDDLDTAKLDESALNKAIDNALAQAKASGAFDGEDGTNGTSVTVSKVTESTESGGSNVVTFSDGKKVTVKNGKTPVKSVDYFTEADKTEMVNLVLAQFTNVSEVAL